MDSNNLNIAYSTIYTYLFHVSFPSIKSKLLVPSCPLQYLKLSLVRKIWLRTRSSMYLAGQSHDNDLGESAAGDVIVIENEERPNGSTGSWQPSTTSASTRDRETHPMRQKHPNAQMRLRNDEVDDDDNDEQEKEELPGDNVTCFPVHFGLFL